MVILTEWLLLDPSPQVLLHKAQGAIASLLWCTPSKHLPINKALAISWASIRITRAFRLVITIANRAHIKIVSKYILGSKHSQSAKVMFKIRFRKDQWQDWDSSQKPTHLSMALRRVPSNPKSQLRLTSEQTSVLSVRWTKNQLHTLQSDQSPQQDQSPL